MMGMGQRPPQRPPTGPSPYTAGRPNPMAQGGGANYAPMAPPPQQWGGSFGTGKLGPMGPQGPMGGAPGPSPWQGGQATPMMGQIVGGGPQGMSDAMMHPFAPRNRGAQGVGPNYGGSQGTPPWMGAQLTGSEGGPSDPTQQMQNSLAAMRGGMGGGGQWTGGGAQGLGPMQGQIQNSLGAMQGAMGGGPQPSPWGGANVIQPAVRQMQGAMGPGYQRRFPGALQRGIMQGMAPPPQAPPAPYGGQQFRMW
jgi:hypothetical protein